MEIAEKLALKKPNSSPNWSQLPSELLHLISKNLTLIFDYISFRSVCSPWRSAARPLDLPPQLPLFVITASTKSSLACDSGIDDEILQLFSLSEPNKLCRLDLPKPHSKRCIGSAHGWLLIHDIDPFIFLLNPFTRSRIQLPPITTMPGVVGFDPERDGEEYSCVDMDRISCEEMHDWLALRPVISSNPSDGDWVLMVSLCNYCKLAFCRPGDESWTELDCELIQGYEALAYHDKKFYAIGEGTVMACDVSVLPPKANVILSLERRWDEDVYLVSSGVGLLLIKMYSHEEDGRDTVGGFNVFKMDDAGGKTPRWEMIHSLDGEALFLCDDYGMSIKADEFPGIDPDCIYHPNPFYKSIEYNLDGSRRIRLIGSAVFNMKDRSTKMIRFYPDNGLEWKRAGWLRPTLH